MSGYDPSSKEGGLGQSALEHCRGLATVIDRIGDKWTVMVVGLLSENDPLRFTALRRAIPGVSQRMLALTLRGLERDGLVRRTAHATATRRVDYALTELGRSLSEPLNSVAKWAATRRADIEAARRLYDQTRDAA